MAYWAHCDFLGQAESYIYHFPLYFTFFFFSFIRISIQNNFIVMIEIRQAYDLNMNRTTCLPRVHTRGNNLES